MATSVATPIVLAAPAVRRQSERAFALSLVSGLTVLAVAVHGYHPYSEDGGLYVAGIKRLIDPALYPHETAFVTEHVRFSLFAPAMAQLVRASHLRLDVVLALVYAASFWLTLFAAWLLATRCFSARAARCGAVSLLAVWMTLPIAGTALMLMDPYVTARSISTPCSLLALAGALRFFLPQGTQRVRGLALTLGSLAVASAVHPLMAGDAAGCLLLLGCISSRNPRIRRWGTVGLCAAAVALAAVVSKFAPTESAFYRQAGATRYYWFLSQWHWYELVGLGAPLAILAFIALSGKREGGAAKIALARMSVVAGATAVTIVLLFARINAANYMIARLQPLRVFQLVYVVMILVLGAAAGDRLLQRRPARWVAALLLLGGVMFYASRRTYPASAHIEWPRAFAGNQPRNQWEQAFLWIKANTPKDALFALDADYIARPGEDAQCFRAIAERSALPDYSKDGGEASIAPHLAGPWAAGQAAQARLSTETDAERIAQLGPLRVTWVVLDTRATTGFNCPFSNSAVKVCRLP